jgi:aminoglycoside/choline kinase family phosphotransferase
MTASAPAIDWADPARGLAFSAWLSAVAPSHALLAQSVRPASADASFRRYFRVDALAQGPLCARSYIIMDAPPEKEDCHPFVKVAGLMAEAGLSAPRVLAWDETMGFMLLSDLGAQTMMEVINPPLSVDVIAEPTAAHLDLYMQAVDALVRWQLASRPGVLPPYDDALLSRELALFPEWYVGRHRGITLDAAKKAVLNNAFEQIKASNLTSLSAARVYVHRDYMPRNLMVRPTLAPGDRPPLGGPAPSGGSDVHEVTSVGAEPGDRPPLGGPAPSGGSDVHEVTSVGAISILDFQDAVYGPITYDIASLMRDAFLSWDEDFVLDVTARYWQKARQAGLPVGDDFGEFYRAVEWMGLQRHLKILGIFARLTLRDGKPAYLADTPRFVRYVRATCARYRQLGPLMVLLDQIEGNETRVGYTF